LVTFRVKDDNGYLGLNSIITPRHMPCLQLLILSQDGDIFTARSISPSLTEHHANVRKVDPDILVIARTFEERSGR